MKNILILLALGSAVRCDSPLCGRMQASKPGVSGTKQLIF